MHDRQSRDPAHAAVNLLAQRLRRGSQLRAALLFSTACCSAPLVAQTSPGDTPAGTPSVYQNVDENGVDLTDGSFNLAITEGTIGAGEGALSIVRYLGAGGTRDNVSAQFRRSESPTTAFIDVMAGNRRETFTGPKVGTTFTSKEGTGSTLTKLAYNSYRYTASDGSVTMYGVPDTTIDGTGSELCGADNSASCGLVAVSTVEPTGATTSFQWDVGQDCRSGQNVSLTPDSVCTEYWRQRGVSNNSGYSLRFSFLQETNSRQGYPAPEWYTRTGAVLSSGTATRAVSYAAPSAGVTQITTDGGKVWTLTGGGQSLSRVDPPGGPAITIARDANGSVSSVTRNGVTTNYVRSVSGTTGTMTKTVPGRGTTTIVSDLNIGRPTKVTNALNQATSFTYDPPTGLLTKVTAPEGNSTAYAYDTRGNVVTTQAIAKPNSGAPTITTTASYPATCSSSLTCNKPTSTTNGRGSRTDYIWDQTHGGLTSVTAPPGTNGVRPQTRYSYTQAAAPDGSQIWLPVATSACNTTSSCVGTADETTTTIAYEPTHLLARSVTTAAGNGVVSATSSVAYDPVGNPVSVDGPLSGTDDTTTAIYDQDRQVIATIGPDPDGAGPRKRTGQHTTFDAAGRPTLVEYGTATGTTLASFTPVQTLQTAYDANGRPVQELFRGAGAIQTATQYSYDAAGQLDCTAQRMNPALFGNTPGACSLGTQGAAGPDRITQNVYDVLGRVTTLRTAVGTAVQADEATVGYTANGQQAWVQDGNGNRTTYLYDGLDRVATVRLPGATPGASSTTDYESYGYDANGNLTSQRLRDGLTVTYGFDALDRLGRRGVTSNDVNLYFSHDNLGRLTSANDGTVNATFGYDALGRKVSEGSARGTILSQYDAAGRRTRLTYEDGFFVTYGYSVTGEMTQVRENGATSGVGLLAQYAYDDLGRRTSLTRGSGLVTNYAYDPASRLGQLQHTGAGIASTKTFAYNPASEIVQAIQSNTGYDWATHVNVDSLASINGLNQITKVGTNLFGYDNRGNLTSDNEKTFVYNSRNQLVQYTGGALYSDALGRLTNISAEGISMTHDGAETIAEYSTAGPVTLVRRYVYGPGTDEPIVWYEGSGTTDRRFYHADERGSTVALSNGAGQEIAKLTYDEYGIPGPTNTGRLQYTGQKWVPSLGAYDYKARIYSASLGRFLQTDPIGYGDGLNMYGYVGGDPVNGTDPTGLKGCPHDSSTPDIIYVCGSKFGPAPTTHLKSGDGGGGFVQRPWWGLESGGRTPPGLLDLLDQPDPGQSREQPKADKPGKGKPQKVEPKKEEPSLIKRVVCSTPANAAASTTAGLLTAPRVAAASRLIRGSIAVSRAVEGAVIGAEVGAFGGPVGLAVGLAVGITTSLAISYAQEAYCAK